MPSFEEIGLREELLRSLEDEDFVRPTALQEAVIPALRRGGNLVARASSGSGKTLAYTLGIIDRLGSRDESEVAGPRAIVLVPTTEVAESTALSIITPAQAAGFAVAVSGSGWGTPLSEADFLVSTVAAVMRLVRTSDLKLDDVEAFVIDDAASIAKLGDWDEVDALLDLVPRDAQRILISGSIDRTIEDLIDRRVKRALRYPAEAAVPSERGPSPTETCGYLVATEPTKLRLLATQLSERESGGPPPIIFCRTDERAATLAEALTTRGFVVGEPDDEEADVVIASSDTSREEIVGAATGDTPQTVSFDVPADAGTLSTRHAGDPDAIVLVEPRELSHLHEISRQAGFLAKPTSIPERVLPSESDLAAYRDDLRRAVREEDLSAQLLILEPLLQEYTASEIAAATSALLRSKRPIQPPAPVAPAVSARPSVPRAAPTPSPAGPPPATWARLFISIGSRDDVRPADIVGAVAGEADIPGSRIGKIEIRDSFSIVEVQADVADKVIQAVNGTTLKGRSVRVDYDRGGPSRRPPPRTSRRTSREPRRP